MSEAVEKVERILKDKYSTQSYLEFIVELFAAIKVVAPDKYHKEVSNFSSHIDGYSHFGDYVTLEKKRVSFFSVCLKTASYVENSRGAQRGYARKLIDAGNCDAAIIAFYAPNDLKWRLSFVRLDYEMKFENGKFQATENLTPAKRYSFLVGKDEPCHTAISRFHNLIIDKNFTPSLDEIEEAFSVERVTKEFFELYCEKYYQLQEYLEGNSDFIQESARCGFTSEQFAKKLMGQIVFLYFLQKKGWLGVGVWPNTITEKEYKNIFYVGGAQGRIIKLYLPQIYTECGDGVYKLNVSRLDDLSESDEEVIASNLPRKKTWGDGSRSFLRTMYEWSQKHGGHFYENYLKPLFYNALNRNRGTFGYCRELHCRVPFLAGGLFDPLENYDWKSNCFDIPDSMFSNKVNDNDRDGSGILDIFDRYNFTISEDEPMEREVAIDPEMLGKVFENLLEVKDRKTKGAFYTPREIVHYMCRESLIKYLAGTIDVDEADIRDFIIYGDLMKDEDTTKQKRQGNGEMLISDKLFCVDENGNVIVNRLIDMDTALACVRVADPAVGSGAFPLGMMNEIVRARQNITPYITIGMNAFDKRMLLQNERSAYRLKLHTIRHSIFAVDIEPSAIDIAQLRLWLSLVIDDEINPSAQNPLEGHRNPLPLPNLECNIICGDSLKNSFGDLGTRIANAIEKTNSTHSVAGIEVLLHKLLDEQDQLFICEDPNKKKQLCESIQATKDLILRSQLGDQEIELFDDYRMAMRKASKRLLIWQLEFAKAFVDNKGFDIVIGNPPYVQLQKSLSKETNEKVGDQYSTLGYQTFVKSGDMYCLFYELGAQLLREGGCLAFITSNKWLKTAYGEQLRKYLAGKTDPQILIDFSGTRVFETAGVDVNILLTQKAKNRGKTTVCTIKELGDSKLETYISANSQTMSFVSQDKWIIIPGVEETIKQKILKVGKPISEWKINIKYGIKTCLNKVYVIDDVKKNALCREDPSSIEVLSPVLRGRDIGKWTCNYCNLWLVAVHNGIHKLHVPPVDIDRYPAVKSYLTPFMEELEKRIDQGITPYHLKNCTYYEEYAKPKIVFQEIEQSSTFALDAKGEYMCLDTVRIITGDHLEYLTGLLNSDLFFFAVKHYFSGGQLGEKGVRMKHTFFKAFTAYVPTEQEEEYIKSIVLSESVDKDERINEFFYSKYDISESERAYIETDIYK